MPPARRRRGHRRRSARPTSLSGKGLTHGRCSCAHAQAARQARRRAGESGAHSASALFAGGVRSNNSNPRLRARPMPGRLIAEQLDEAVGKADHAAAIAGAPGFETREQLGTARSVPCAPLWVAASSSASIAASRKPRLNPWPATGCSACAGIADEHRTGRHRCERATELQRIGRALTHSHEAPRTPSEGCLQLLQEGFIARVRADVRFRRAVRSIRGPNCHRAVVAGPADRPA